MLVSSYSATLTRNRLYIFIAIDIDPITHLVRKRYRLTYQALQV